MRLYYNPVYGSIVKKIDFGYHSFTERTKMDSTNHDYKYYANLGVDETNKGNFDSAIEALDKAIELKPDRDFLYFSKAVAFHNKMELEEAYENYKKALEINPKMIDAYYNLAQVILARKPAGNEDLKEALNNLEKPLNLTKNLQTPTIISE